MPLNSWLKLSLKDQLHPDPEKCNNIIRFNNEFDSLFLNQNEEEDIFKSQSAQYKDQVFYILNNGKARLPLSDEELLNIQMEIEDLTMTFDEESMFKSAPNIIKK